MRCDTLSCAAKSIAESGSLSIRYQAVAIAAVPLGTIPARSPERSAFDEVVEDLAVKEFGSLGKRAYEVASPVCSGRGIIRSCAVSLALTFFATIAQAQSLTNHVPLQDSTYDYRVLPYEPTVAGLINQANSEGAQRFLYGGNYVFSSTVSIYGRAVSSNVTATYQSIARPASAAALVTQLNTQGAAGFLYLGDYSVSDSLLVNYSGNDTFAYRELPTALTEADFLTQVNTQGAQGYAFMGNVGFPAVGGSFVFSSLFVKNSAVSETFQYETRNTSPDVTAFLSQAGTQGRLGYRYSGDLIFNSPSLASRSLYVKNNARSDRFYYEALGVANSAPDFLAQANAMGTRKYLYYSNMGFGTPATQFASIYVSLSDVLFRAGFD